MQTATRKTYCEVIGDVLWGTHLCLFYETKEDLIDILVPYFKAGLEHNECCMWMTSEPLPAEEAKLVLKKEINDLAMYLEKGQIEFLDYSQWYTKSGRFDADRVLQGWVEKEDQAIKRGFDGLRLSGNTFWLEKNDWKTFTEYEATVDSVIGKHQIIAICTYSLDKCGAFEVIDAVSTHESTLIKRKGKWETIKSAKRERVEEALRESEAKYRLLFESAPVGIGIADYEGTILDGNPGMSRITGYTHDELKNIHLKDTYVDPDKRKHLLNILQKEGRLHDWEIKLKRKDGTVYDALLNIDQIELGGRKLLLTTARDITKRKRIEEALQKRTDELTERVKELNCLYSISHLVEKPGISLEEILQGTVELIPAAWRYPEITCARIVSKDRGEFKTENWRETPWKQTNSIIVRGKPTGTLEVVYLEEKPESDEEPFLQEERNLLNAITERLGKIIERMQAEEAVRVSESQYRFLVENVADGIGIIQEETLIFVNDALCSILGLRPDQLIGMNPVDLFRDDYKEHFREIFEQTKKHALHQYIQAVCITGDSREIWVEELHSLTDWEGKPAIIMTMRDITEHKLRDLAIEKEKDYLKNVNVTLRATMKDRYRFGDIIGKSPAMQEVYELILNAAASDVNVVIYGESGTGKELIAWTIHYLSMRKDKAFAPVNCGAITETLFESEFFGHRKGAFTGAHQDTQGFFDYAHGGTLFLDEVGELTLSMQIKLLRALAGGGHTPVGDHTVKQADVRIVAATNQDLTEMVKQGTMRKDFFFRIHVIPITVPPLRDHKEDIPLLVDYFLEQYSQGKRKPSLPGIIIKQLYDYEWPGNVRELQNVLQRYLTTNRLDFPNLDNAKPVEKTAISGIEAIQEGLGLQKAMEDFEKQCILSLLEQHHWHRGKTAATLHISRRSLFRKMEKYGLA